MGDLRIVGLGEKRNRPSQNAMKSGSGRPMADGCRFFVAMGAILPADLTRLQSILLHSSDAEKNKKANLSHCGMNHSINVYMS